MLRRSSLAIALTMLFLASCGARPVAPLAQPAIIDAAGQAKAEARRIFDFTDANHDGRITLAEVLQAPTGQPIGRYKPGEKEKQARELFARLDVNRDAALSFEEFKAGMVGQAMVVGQLAH